MNVNTMRSSLRLLRHNALVQSTTTRALSTVKSHTNPRHLLRISDLTTPELITLINNATTHRSSNLSSGSWPLRDALSRNLIALMFSKLSTRTRISTEGAVVAMGGHPMFLGKNDIQLGVNETLYDTSVVVSSMVSGIVARVGPHSDIASIAKHSSVPVINALCDTYHPLQIIADFATISQVFETEAGKLAGVKIAWVGDANNVLFDMCVASKKLGVDVAVATPKGYEIPRHIKQEIQNADGSGKLSETTVPEEAVKDADIVVTDTWISMGQEGEKTARTKAFQGYQVSEEMGKRGGAKSNWKFMHCLPRHQEEVSDEVFYGQRSLVFPEAQNRLYSAISVLEGFVANKGEIKKTDA